MMADDLPDEPERSKLAAQSIADDRVLLDHLEFVGRQRRRLEQDRIGDADLADVVQIRAALERGQLFPRQADRGAERPGELREPLAAAVGGGIARVNRQRKTFENRFGRFELVGVALQADERRDSRVQLLVIEWLGEEIVRTGVNAANAMLARAVARREDDRDEPRP